MSESRVERLVAALDRPSAIPPQQRIFANRNLRLDRAELIGFDMDYTLALYDQPKMEALSIKATVDKLIGDKGYAEAVRSLPFDSRWGVRGLVIDRQTGNTLKPDRYGITGRAYHGTRRLDRATLRELYQRERTRLSNARYAFIDTLFALPEAVMFVAMVDYFDANPEGSPGYELIWDDIRDCIDRAHADGSIKNLIAKDLANYIPRDPELGEALHKMRSTGKRLFLLTNSAWDYTNPVMQYLLDDTVATYPGWRNFFDIVVVSSAKPGFFTMDRPFVDLGADGIPRDTLHPGPFQRGHIYQGGNLKEFEERSGARGDKVVFVGDHIYGDMLRSRKSSAWRTVMILQELEKEIELLDGLQPALASMEELERHLRQLDAEVEEKQVIMGLLQKMDDADDGVEAARTAARDTLARLRDDLLATMSAHEAREQEVDSAFNPFWGSMLKEGREVSKFGDQVEDFACLYTSRVSNFRYYSPMRHFRGPRDRMPHER
ncbi:MAG: HAD-IG family 5'-nucleotidase [Deltaproteobacteria bacterium]|nr:HAD-IG family 5'-nucleotidase [Deltaproteobacteria bacterium]